MTRTLRIIALISLIIMAWAVTINQVFTLIDKQTVAESQIADDFLGDCIKLGASRVLMVDGEPYCWATFQGTDYVESLAKLQQR